MNIVLSTDNNFVQHCAVTMVSIMENNKDVSFFIITDGLTTENQNILSGLSQKYNTSLQFLLVNKSIIERLPMPNNRNLKHISPATYYRLFVAELLPSSVDKLIYLDCDMVIRGSLMDLWNTDITNYALAAVYQDNQWAINNHTFERLSIPQEKGYFNAGMLVINLKYWRENQIQEQLLDYLHTNSEKIVYHDQDVLNVVLHDYVKGVFPIWNMLTVFFMEKRQELDCGCYQLLLDDIKTFRREAVIIHYVSRPKPWEYACNHPLCKEYFKYLDLTVFAKWRPSFTILNIWLYKIKPILLNMRNFCKIKKEV